jgi:hypothetical protein
VKDRVEGLLSQYLDPRAAEMAIRIASRTWLRTEPEALVDGQLLGLTHGLAPLLEKLLGPELARSILDRLVREARENLLPSRSDDSARPGSPRAG